MGIELNRTFGEGPGQSPCFVGRREVGKDAVGMAGQPLLTLVAEPRDKSSGNDGADEREGGPDTEASP